MNELDGKTALVTGATSGLGKATALALAAEGATVVVHGRDPGRGSETVTEIEAAGGKARFVAADLRDPAGVAHLAQEAGEVDILVNNAGSSWFGPSEQLGVDGYDLLFDGNVRSAYLLTAALAPGMAARGEGSIVNIGSMAGAIGLAGGAAYSATKASMDALTRAWAAEFSPAGVRVNSVAPGPVHTPSTRTEVIDSLATTTLLGRAGRPQEIADVIAFLSGPRAAYVTGATAAARPCEAMRTVELTP